MAKSKVKLNRFSFQNCKKKSYLFSHQMSAKKFIYDILLTQMNTFYRGRQWKNPLEIRNVPSEITEYWNFITSTIYIIKHTNKWQLKGPCIHIHFRKGKKAHTLFFVGSAFFCRSQTRLFFNRTDRPLVPYLLTNEQFTRKLAKNYVNFYIY